MFNQVIGDNMKDQNHNDADIPTWGKSDPIPGQKEEKESLILLSRWKVDMRTSLADPFQGGPLDMHTYHAQGCHWLSRG